MTGAPAAHAASPMAAGVHVVRDAPAPGKEAAATEATPSESSGAPAAMPADETAAKESAPSASSDMVPLVPVEAAPTPGPEPVPVPPPVVPQGGRHTVPRKGTGMIVGGSLSLGIGVPLLLVAAPNWFLNGPDESNSAWNRSGALFTIPGIILTATGGALLGVGLHRRARWKRGDPIMDVYEHPAAPRRVRAKIISGSVLTGVFAPLTGFSIYIAVSNGLAAGLLSLVPLAVTTPLLATGGVLLGKGLSQRRTMGEAYYRALAGTPTPRWSPFVGGVGPLPGRPRLVTPTYGVNLRF